MTEKKGFKDSLLRAIAIIGLIAVLVLGAWGIIQLVVGLPDFFARFGSNSSISTTSTEQVVVSAPASLTSDQPFTLSWTHTGGSGNYGYGISYACATGLTFAAPVPTGQMQIVPCDTPFNFTTATKEIQLVPVFHTTGSVTTTFKVEANSLVDGKITATGKSSSVTVRASSASATPTPTPTTTKPATSASQSSATSYTPSGRTSNLYGSPDLSVQIVSVAPGKDGRYVAQFVIQNIGTNVTPAGWAFSAQVPTNPVYTFLSQPQQKMYPGDEIVYTLGFDLPGNLCDTYNCAGSGIFSVTVDPRGVVSESTKYNNTASAPISNAY